MCSSDLAKQYTGKPVYLRAWEGATPMYVKGEPELMEGPTSLIADKCYEKAGLGPEDIDVAQVHDAFTPGEIFTVEHLHFCPEGEGGPFVWEGNTEIGGKIPVNTDGGLKSCGHPVGASGVRMINHISDQMRGRADKMQVEGASLGLAHTLGGPGAISCVMVLGAP